MPFAYFFTEAEGFSGSNKVSCAVLYSSSSRMHDYSSINDISCIISTLAVILDDALNIYLLILKTFFFSISLQLFSMWRAVGVDELLIGYQDVAGFYTTFLKYYGRGECLGTTTCLKTVVKGVLPVKYFSYNKVSFLCQSNFMEIIRLLLR